MSAVPFYAVDTSARTLECTRAGHSSRLAPPSTNSVSSQRSSSFTGLSSSCHQEDTITTKPRSSSFNGNPTKAAFDQFTF